jgi:hypothetical protein
MRTISTSLTLASVAICSAITFGAGTASAANITHVDAALDFIMNASVNDTDISNGCSINWATYEGHTKGACFFIEALKHGNGYTDDYTSTDINTLWGAGSPTSHQLYVKLDTSPGVGSSAPSPETYFRKITSIGNLQEGDIIIIDSQPAPNTYAGHVLLARGPAALINPQINPKFSGTIQWAVPIADSTDSKHGCNPAYPDSRWFGDCTTGYGPGAGAGTGYIRIYTDILTGALLGYTWSVTSATSTSYYSPSTRPYRIGRLTNLPPPAPPPPPPPPPPPVGTPI